MRKMKKKKKKQSGRFECGGSSSFLVVVLGLCIFFLGVPGGSGSGLLQVGRFPTCTKFSGGSGGYSTLVTL